MYILRNRIDHNQKEKPVPETPLTHEDIINALQKMKSTPAYERARRKTDEFFRDRIREAELAGRIDARALQTLITPC